MGRLPVRSASTDLTVCSLALEHEPDPEPAITELARVTRVGGRVLISDVHPFAILSRSPRPVRAGFGQAAPDPGLSTLPWPVARAIQAQRSRRRAVHRTDDGSRRRTVRSCLSRTTGRRPNRRRLGGTTDRPDLAAHTGGRFLGSEERMPACWAPDEPCPLGDQSVLRRRRRGFSSKLGH